MDLPGVEASAPHQHLLDPAARDELASDPLLRDTDLFEAFNKLFEAAGAAVDGDEVGMRALGLETALFGWVTPAQFAPQFTTPEVLDRLAGRMASPSARVRMTVGKYLWDSGSPAHKRHGGAAAAAAYEWARVLFEDTADPRWVRFHAGVRALETAVNLAVASGQRRLIAEICVCVAELTTKAARASETDPAVLLADVIVELRGRFTSPQRRELVKGLHELHAPALADISPASPPILAGRFLDVRRQLAHADGDTDSALACDRDHAALIAAHAADRGDALVEAVFLNDAIALAERGQEDIATLNRYRQRRRAALTRGMATMPRVTFTGRLPEKMAQQLDEEHERLVNLPVGDFIRAFANYSRPTMAALQASLQHAAVNMPMTTLMSRLVIASPGETVAATSEEANLLMEHGLRLLQVGVGLHLLPIWRGRLDRGDMTADALVDVLRSSGNFEADNMEIIAPGVEAAVRGDPVVALHILLPQLEDVLRSLLQRSGHDPNRQNPSDPDVTEEISLGSIIVGLHATQVITPDDMLLFQLVLDHPLGLNLRNRVGHGLVRVSDCSPEALVCVLQCYAVVAALPAVLDVGATPA